MVSIVKAVRDKHLLTLIQKSLSSGIKLPTNKLNQLHPVGAGRGYRRAAVEGRYAAWQSVA